MLELAFSEVDRRFEQHDIGMITTIESLLLLLDASNGKPVQMSHDISIFLKNDLNQDHMKARLLMLKDAIKTWYLKS